MLRKCGFELGGCIATKCSLLLNEAVWTVLEGPQDVVTGPRGLRSVREEPWRHAEGMPCLQSRVFPCLSSHLHAAAPKLLQKGSEAVLQLRTASFCMFLLLS